jgi:general secretion pathway protein L
MLKQCVNMSAPECRKVSPTAVVPLPGPQGVGEADAELRDVLLCLAAASGRPSPQVVPGAAVLLLPVHLPLKTDRRRRAALPFAVEPFLAAVLDETALALGPRIEGDRYLAAAADRDWIATFEPGPVLPDLLAVPLPDDPDAWALWCGAVTAHIRTGDGGGLSLPMDQLRTLWVARGRPPLYLCRGNPPAGVRVNGSLEKGPDASVLQLDLAQGDKNAGLRWTSWARFAAVLATLTALGHGALLNMDANALARVAVDLRADTAARLQSVAPDLSLALDPRVLLARLTENAEGSAPDAFLLRFAQVSEAWQDNPALSLQNLRFDAESDSLLLSVSAPDLDGLQQAEALLSEHGLVVTAGAASMQDSGAEMQIAVTGGG